MKKSIQPDILELNCKFCMLPLLIIGAYMLFVPVQSMLWKAWANVFVFT